MNIVQTPHSRVISIPILNTADLVSGSLIMPGVTAETNMGVGIKNTAASNADAIGILAELFDYSECGDASVAGAADWYRANSGYSKAPAKQVSLIDTGVLCRVDYDLTSAMTIASMSSTTEIVVTSIENDIDTSFLYSISGTSIGELMFVKSDDATTLTITSALTTAPVAADTLVKILRLFHQVVVWTTPSATAETKLATTAAVGTGRAVILDRYIVRRGLHEHLDPVAHHNAQDLDHISDLRFYALAQVLNTAFHPID